MKFIVEGTFKIGALTQKFVKEIEAQSAKRATEMTYTKLGSDHGTKRTQIKIDKVEEWKE